MHPYDFIFSGLALDVVGAVVLAKGFIFKNPRAAHYESLTIVGSNPFILRSALLQRAEACIGASLLMLGFLLQIWGNLHGGIEASEPGWINSFWRMLLVVIGAIAVGVVAVYLGAWNARRQFYGVFFRGVSHEAKLQPTPKDEAWYDRMSLLLDLKRQRNEADATLLTRIQMRWSTLAKEFTANDG